MSMGYGAVAKKYSESNEAVIYEYYAFNLNEKRYLNPEREFDGLIEIKKSCIPAPIIHTKIMKRKNGRNTY